MSFFWPVRHLVGQASVSTQETTGPVPAEELEQLYRRFGPAIHRRALSLTGDPEEALDITQDTFLAFMEKRATLCRAAGAFTVLYQIATHKAVDRLRRRARWSGKLKRLSAPPEDSDEDAVAHLGGMERVEAAGDLALLTEGEEWQVLTAAFLYFVEGHSLTEVGQTMDLCGKTVRKLLGQFIRRASKRVTRLGTQSWK